MNFEAPTSGSNGAGAAATAFTLIGTPWTPSKGRWLVKTESNVPRTKLRRPDPPCVVCKGFGKVKCATCKGRGRTNLVDQPILPKGVWPKWCAVCGASGLSYCGRCLGTGERRGVIGFHLPNVHSTS